jgi:hypothetical protein
VRAIVSQGDGARYIIGICFSGISVQSDNPLSPIDQVALPRRFPSRRWVSIPEKSNPAFHLWFAIRQT